MVFVDVDVLWEVVLCFGRWFGAMCRVFVSVLNGVVGLWFFAGWRFGCAGERSHSSSSSNSSNALMDNSRISSFFLA